MNTQQNSQTNSSRYPRWLAPALLFIAGVTLIAGYNMHLAGFTGWATLVIAGASLFVSGGLWGEVQRVRFALLALGVALVGAILCLPALIGQMQGSDMVAAGTNLIVILSQLGAAFLIWQNTSPMLKAR